MTFDERFKQVQESIKDLSADEIKLLKAALRKFYEYGIEDSKQESQNAKQQIETTG